MIPVASDVADCNFEFYHLCPIKLLLPVWICDYLGHFTVSSLFVEPYNSNEARYIYFLNKLSNAARASFGRKLAGVEVSFSRVTRISYNWQSFRASFFAMRSFTGCMHSNRLPGSKYVHCLHECNSNPHFGH
jgi:hypothetical protein